MSHLWDNWRCEGLVDRRSRAAREMLTRLRRSAGSNDLIQPQGSLGKRYFHAFGRHGKFSETAAGRMSEGVG
jgi:hypothetical protein